MSGRPRPSIIGPEAHSRVETDPPVFRIDLGATGYFGVELASDPGLFDARSEAARSDDTFFASWVTGLIGPVDTTTYAPPSEAWTRLRDREAIYYRVISSAAKSGWVEASASAPDPDGAEPPRVRLTGDVPRPNPRAVRFDRG
jgi:hypothetical protein